jgi:hypothetical protein
VHQRSSSLARNRPLRSQLEPSCLSVSSLAFFLSSLVPMAQKRARPTSSVEGFDGRDDAPEEEERVFFDDDNAEHTMSDLPVLMEIAWPSLTEGCGKRPCGALFSSCRWSCFFSTFLLVGNIGGACVEWRRALCTVRSTFSDTLLREQFSWSLTAPPVHSLLVG